MIHEALRNAVMAKLVADATLVNLLAKHKADGVSPGIYADGVVIPDAPMPYLAFNLLAGAHPRVKNTNGKVITAEFHAYSTKQAGALVLDQIMDRLDALLFKQRLTVTGWANVIADVSGVFDLPVGEDYHGAGLNATWTAYQDN